MRQVSKDELSNRLSNITLSSEPPREPPNQLPDSRHPLYMLAHHQHGEVSSDDELDDTSPARTRSLVHASWELIEANFKGIDGTKKLGQGGYSNVIEV